uniref:Uncharacterized protein n=1 Tax=Arundo donax TaxID=35708 RepID=A0A0A9BYP2_ARUDO
MLMNMAERNCSSGASEWLTQQSNSWY